MTSDDPSPVEVFILGDLIVRRDGADVPGLTTTLAKTLVLLAVQGGPLRKGALQGQLGNRTSDDSVYQNIKKLRKQGLPIGTSGPRGDTAYYLDLTRCRVDAVDFVRGVDAGQEIDGLLRRWRGAVPEGVLNSPPWSAVKDARTRLIKRISELPEADQGALSGLARFADLFRDDQEVDRIRPAGPRSRPRLLVVEDSPDMMAEISGRLDARYRLTCLRSIDEWRDFRTKKRQELDLLQGALIDLSLTRLGNDKKGLEIVTYLRDNTGIPVALVTANRMESSEFLQAERMTHYRLVDIVNKHSDDWYDALETTAGLLVGNGVKERQRRMETWLNAAHHQLRQETSDASPGSVAFSRRKKCDEEYASLLGLVRVGDVDAADEAVKRFCANWRTSG